MAGSRALYEQVILEHNKKPRNFHTMDDATHHAIGHNPLCGDKFDIYLKMKDGAIDDVSFDGSGCAISKSSASIMTQLVKGKTIDEVNEMFKQFHAMITADPSQELDEDTLGRMAVFAGVREFPVRIKCATLAWYTLLSAIENKSKTTTE